VGTPLSFPTGISSGPLPGRLHEPLGITLLQEGNKYYSFITNSGDSTILRVTYSNSLVNAPVYDVLQVPGILTKYIFGIQVKNENGNWYGFVTNGSSLVRLDFGTSLTNLSPSATTVASSPFMNKAQGLAIGYDGQDWVGFCTNFPAQTITRFAWGSTLTSVPVVSNLGNLGGLTIPMQPALINDGTGWYMFVCNTTTLAQLKFGNSLMNAPTGSNLGNLVWINDNRGISIFAQCGNPYALLANHNVVLNQLFQIHFKGGLGGAKFVTPLGSPGQLYETVALSESLNLGDTIFCIALNTTPSLSILYFTPCTSTIIPASTQFDPSPVIFPAEGSYTIKLTVDKGLPTEQQACKEIAVTAVNVNLGPDTTLCDGSSVTLDAGKGFQSYLWNTGSAAETITVTTTGTYSVTVSDKLGCMAEDSIHIVFKPNSAATVDTTICYGTFYFAGGKPRSSSGTYTDTLVAPNGCKNIVTTHLSVKPVIPLNIGKDTCMNEGTTIDLVANVPGASSYTWQDGTHNAGFTVTGPGSYWVRVEVDNCTKSDSIQISTCPKNLYFYMPTAFSPNGDGLNDVFRPVGNEIVEFHMLVYDRWGQLVFETQDFEKGWNGTFKGALCEPGVYSYILTYGNGGSQGGTQKIKGFVTLVK
jgi:gliding motility-associated-like protein